MDLVLIDQQSVGKRSLHLMDTVNAEKRWTTIYWRVNKFLICYLPKFIISSLLVLRKARKTLVPAAFAVVCHSSFKDVDVRQAAGRKNNF
jgi:hypothetical protein